jgi:hypothetical protein
MDASLFSSRPSEKVLLALFGIIWLTSLPHHVHLLIRSQQLVGSGPDYKSYYHQYFLRGKPDLCRLMDTTVNTGELIPDIVSEPNLYVISNLYPLPEDPCMPREQESIDLFMRDALQNEARGADDTY